MTEEKWELTKSTKLTPRQLQIYNGLKSIGAEIAAFYLDGLRILTTEVETKSYLLAHIAREIEGGLRDILVVREKAEMPRCEKCDQHIRGEEDNHINQICMALDVKNDHPFATKWHNVAKEFHKYAHRRGAWKEPRETTEFQELWKEFEDVLFQLIGTYFNLLELIDRILKYDKPSEPILETLSNLLKVEARHSYFFKNLKSLYWLRPLKEKGFFGPQNNPQPQAVPDQPGYYTIPHWSVLDYLEHLASKNLEEPSDQITDALVEIVNSIIDYREDGKRIDNYRTDWIMVKIISTFPVERIEDNHIEFVRASLKSSWPSTLVAAGIGKSLLAHLIKNEAKSLLLKLLEVMFDYDTERKLDDAKYKSLMDKYWLFDALKKHKSL